MKAGLNSKNLVREEIERIKKEIILKKPLLKDPRVPLKLDKVVENFLKDYYSKNEIVMRFEDEIKKEVVEYLRNEREKIQEI